MVEEKTPAEMTTSTEHRRTLAAPPPVVDPTILRAVPKVDLMVVRKEDFLVLGFEFFNLELRPGRPPTLARTQAERDAFIVVHFPPQSIAEEAFFEAAAEFAITDRDDPDYGKGTAVPAEPPVRC